VYTNVFTTLLWSQEKRREAHPSRAKKRCNISSPIKLASHGLPKQKTKNKNELLWYVNQCFFFFQFCDVAQVMIIDISKFSQIWKYYENIKNT